MRFTPPTRILSALALTAACLVGLSGPMAGTASAAPAGQVLYSPNLSAFPQGDASYPRAIRLDHDGSPNETMLATYARRGHNARASFPIHRSTDGGRTWSANPISTITSNTPGWDLGAPVLYEVPRTANGLDQGDLLASGTAWAEGNFTAQKVEVFKSTDHGVTWTYLSNCTQTSGQPNSIGHGIWEPWFLLTPSNTLACFISDERPANSPTNNQVIGHYTSGDGGQSWSATMTQDVVFPADNLARPGMSIVAALPNGTFLMAYELCRDATNADHACEVYTKTSSNGLSWGSGAGTLVRTSDQRELLHTPYVAWLPGGGANGTLLLSGQRVVAGPTGNKTVLGESGQVLFANTNLGAGAWTEIEAPVHISPTGGYAPGVPSCPGYSSPIVPSANGTDFLYLAATHLTGNQCQVRYGIGTLPGRAGQITGPAGAGKCLDVDTNTNANGNAAQLWDCGVATGQRWSRHPDGTLRAFGKCLDIDANGTANFTKVQLWECNANGGQRWVPQADGSLLNPQSGRCLDAPSGATANGTKLQIYDCNGLDPQKWNLPA
ncbi:ricin-type beta-trefoil lectin domain protein [Nonomuraea fuscirosea]|uniref:ricin-type beta-trefoil lectin domain protein n=1 Tax=Nonomuraea fuscirosea TaxID=1291556 RepID=UPI002DD9CBCB|nr:ricin-type beta-trefoil lectin domain protein [Nonomuraea fuscirosea]WSA52019.1 ricin-type beta-trefoil lectin domain protein [Nonomuraea fuscirosea]